jgi:serine/threonine protein kinase
LGGGSYGIAVKAKKADRYYALKLYADSYLMPKQRSISYCAADLFRREAEILQYIRHPRIPGYVDSFSCENAYCLVQEYIPGNSFAELINQGVRYNEDSVKKNILDLLKILSFLHIPAGNRPAIVHRDLRLSNLIVCDNVLFLVDFGLAYRTDHEADRFFLLNHFQSNYTDNVLPPYLRMRNDLTIQSDLFGVGVVAVDLFTNSSLNCSGKSWEDKAPLSPSLKFFIRRLLGTEKKFASCADAIECLLNFWT